MNILILLPRDRLTAGRLHLFDQRGDKLASYHVLGKADNERAAREGNADRDPTRPYGDTPRGRFEMTAVTDSPNPDKLGRRWIPLVGVEGDALLATERGRVGLGIHAGRGDERLVVTFGCPRLLNRDMAELEKLLGTEKVRVNVEDLE